MDKIFSVRNALLVGIVVAYVLAQSLNNVLIVRLLHKMRGYEWFLVQIIYPLSVCIGTWPLVWFWMLCYPDYLSQRERSFPKWKYFIIAFLSSIGNLTTSVPGSYIPGPLQSVLGTATIPATMIASILFLRKKYSVMHWIGGAVIIGGVLLSVWPDLILPKAHDLFWILFYLSSSLPTAIQYISKEHWIKKEDLNVWYFRGWDALFELCVGLMMSPIVFVDLPGRPHITPEMLPGWIWNSLECFLGFNDDPEGDCSYSWALYLVFFTCNMSFNILSLLIIKYGSASSVVIAGAAVVPCTSLLFLSGFLAGEAAKSTLSIFTAISVVVVVVGMILYRATKEKTKREVVTVKDESENDPEIVAALLSKQVSPDEPHLN